MPEAMNVRQPTAEGLPGSAISLQGLTKTYAASGGQPPKLALHGVDLEVPRGSFFALLGPNGAGKSTLINILAGLVVKSSGRARIFGIDIDAHPRRARLAIGVVPQELNLDAYFSPRETLEFQAGLYGVPRARRRTDEILAAVGLTDRAAAYARSLSGGMRRRLLVAKALVHSPPVVVLDEPTAGVDVELRHALWDYLRALNAAGVTVVLTTHYLEEAEALCDRLAIIDHGRVVASGATRALLAQLDEKELYLTPTARLTELPAALHALGAELLEDGRVRVRYRPSRADVGAILERARQAGIGIRDLATSEADLEELFLRLTASRSAGPLQGTRGGAVLGEQPL